MLRSTFGLLLSGNFDGALKNALIESFAIHLRNLLEFFCKDSNAWPVTEFCSADYTPMERPTALFRQISSQVAHLTANRTIDSSRKLNATDKSNIEKIETEIQRFLAHLTDESKHLMGAPPKDP